MPQAEVTKNINSCQKDIEGLMAAEKQIPKEPNIDYYMVCDPETGETYPLGEVYFCPTCNEMIDEGEHYCWCCNQAITWEK